MALSIQAKKGARKYLHERGEGGGRGGGSGKAR